MQIDNPSINLEIPHMALVAKDDAGELPQGILKILSNFNLTPDESIKIVKRIKALYLKKGDRFCEAGRVCDKIGILWDGLLLATFDTVNGESNVSRFFHLPDNIIVTSFESFKTKTQTNESIIAVENSSLFYFTFDDLNDLYSTVPAMNKIVRHFAEESYAAALRRIHDLQVLSNKERIAKFFSKQKELFNRANKKDIASYLSVNRNDLTREVARLEKNRG